MSDALSFVVGQHVELLPERTTLYVGGRVSNLVGVAGGDSGEAVTAGDSVAQGGSAQNVQEPTSGSGGAALGGGVIGGALGYHGVL